MKILGEKANQQNSCLFIQMFFVEQNFPRWQRHEQKNLCLNAIHSFLIRIEVVSISNNDEKFLCYFFIY